AEDGIRDRNVTGVQTCALPILPTVEVVDMRAELAQGNRSVFSAPLLSALRACMERGEQAMLLMNRRGYHAFVSCRACGHVMKCRSEERRVGTEGRGDRWRERDI